MNLRQISIHAIVPVAGLAVPMVLACAMALPAQAQYSYPDSSDNSPAHQANGIHARAANFHRQGNSTGSRSQPCVPGGPENVPCPEERSDSRNMHSVQPIGVSASERRGYSQLSQNSGNPSMRSGKTCPPGTHCDHGKTATDGSGSGSGYGAQESYGSAAMDSRHQANGIHPIAAGGYGERATASPASIHIPNAPSRETGSMGYVNSYTHEHATTPDGLNPGARGPGTHDGLGQKAPASITTGQQMVGNQAVGGHGLNTSQPTSFMGPNGKRTQLGYQKPTSAEMGSLGKASGGGAPGVNGHSKNFQNGGVDATSQGGAQDFNSTHTYDPGTGKWSPKQDAFHKAAPGALDSVENGVKQLLGMGGDDNGSPGKKKGKKGGDMPVEGVTYGPGQVVSTTTGKPVSPAQKGGTDTGGGMGNTGPQGDPSITNANGRASATLTGEAVDVDRKPQEAGQLKANYNGTGGVIDPKKTGGGG